MNLLENEVELLELINRVRRKHCLHSLSHSKLMAASEQAEAYLLGTMRMFPVEARELAAFTASLVLVKLSEPVIWESYVKEAVFEALTMMEAEMTGGDCLLTRSRLERIKEGKAHDLDAELSLCALLAVMRSEA